MKSTSLLALALCGMTLISTFSQANDSWSVLPYIGLSEVADTDGTTNNIGNADGMADVQLDPGFTAGLGVRYQASPSLAWELAWEYRSNDSSVTLADGQAYSEGNYASNVFFVNALYFFESIGKWQAYTGTGLSWAQEVDIDLEDSSGELSYSGDGEIGYQLFIGTSYPASENMALDYQFRYGSISDIELQGEAIAGGFQGLDYNTMTLQAGMHYRF